MKSEQLFSIVIDNRISIDYCITIDDYADYEKYGVCIMKNDTCNLGEFATANHVFSNREEAMHFIEKLAKESAMPVTLADIIDDYVVGNNL